MSAVVQSKLVSAPALPLLADAELARCFAWRNGAPVSAEEFIADVQALAKLLPPAHYAVNLCQDRYRFLVAFCAVALAGQTNRKALGSAINTLKRLRANTVGIVLNDVRANSGDGYYYYHYHPKYYKHYNAEAESEA